MTDTYRQLYDKITHGQPVADMTPAELRAAERLARAALALDGHEDDADGDD